MPLSFSPRRAALLGVALAASALLGACSSMAGRVSHVISSVMTPYRVEVVQGNVVTSEQVAEVKPGMSREQVRQALGAPLLVDPFHTNRWDYVFLINRQGTPPQKRSVVVLFDDDKVSSVSAPDLPSEREFVASISRGDAAKSTRKLELTPEERAALPAPKPAAAAAAAEPAVPTAGATRSYPPLEAP